MPLINSSVTVTHIATATAIISVDGINLLTDPAFCPAGSAYEYDGWAKAPNLEEWGFKETPPPSTLRSIHGPAQQLSEIPPIDAVLLSHEDHNLLPRPGVVGLQPWQTVEANIGGKHFRITGTPCKHFPGGEVTGFVLETDSFGVDAETGLPNVVYFSGDTVWIDELAELGKRWHVVVAVLNLGNVLFPYPKGVLQITFDGKQAAHLMKVTRAEHMVPIHFECWEHFTEHHAELREVFKQEGVEDKVRWLTPAVATQIV
ncbi:hypothetical protein BDW60DRAFT_218997 [Aspergillus nidulans var. acristatus]